MTVPRDEAPFYVGVDVGGTNIKVGVVTDRGNSLSYLSVPTKAKRGPDHGIDTICNGVEQAVEEAGLTMKEIRAVGLATPGTMDIPGGMLIDPPNLPGWQNIPIRERVRERVQRPTTLQNDANAAAYGEYWVGAGKDVHSMVFWTLGTGIGCGIIIADMIIRGEHSHGSECGHIIIEMTNGRRCATGQYGTLEAYASATALKARCHEALDAGRESILSDWLAGGEELDPLLIAKAAEHGDELADELIMDTAKYMGVGTTSILHTINPNMMLYGGAMTFGRHEKELGRRFLQRIKDEVKARAFPIPYENTIFDYATLGGDAGYIGSAGYARRKHPGNE
ncbi:MAG: ROK family protein [Planctomycetaceae bacterium]|nr:ROK family protein [Planctomycetaceae bacterium]